MATKLKELSWTPRRRGDIYCSPACGARCTFSAFREATNRGKALAKRLGRGWKSRVWENMGWHYAVERGALSVCIARTRRRPSYSVHLGNDAVFYNPQYFTNPKKAVSAQLRHADRVLKRLQQIVAQAKGR